MPSLREIREMRNIKEIRVPFLLKSFFRNGGMENIVEKKGE
jgi:hypothetical protein